MFCEMKCLNTNGKNVEERDVESEKDGEWKLSLPHNQMSRNPVFQRQEIKQSSVIKNFIC